MHLFLSPHAVSLPYSLKTSASGGRSTGFSLGRMKLHETFISLNILSQILYLSVEVNQVKTECFLEFDKIFFNVDESNLNLESHESLVGVKKRRSLNKMQAVKKKKKVNKYGRWVDCISEMFLSLIFIFKQPWFEVTVRLWSGCFTQSQSYRTRSHFMLHSRPRNVDNKIDFRFCLCVSSVSVCCDSPCQCVVNFRDTWYVVDLKGSLWMT